MSHSPFRVHLALTAVAVLFSLNYIISKVALGTFTPLTFAYLRVVGSAAILSMAVRPGSRFEPLDRKDRWRLAGYSMLGVVVNQVLFLAGLALTSAHVAAIVMTMIPIFALTAAIAMSLERATAAKVGGISIAFAGALLVVGTEGLEGSTRSMVGVLLLIGNSLSYSMYLVVSKPAMRRLVPQRVITRMFGMASILMLPICAPSLLHERWATIPTRSWVALLAVILGPTVGAYLLNAWALARAESSLVATYTYLQPFITTILAAFFLRETVRPIVIAAAILIFAGVYLSGRPAPPAARPEAVPGNPD